jgi:hypothetical protein
VQTDVLKIILDADLTKADPNESRKDKFKRGRAGSSSNMPYTFRVDIYYEGEIPQGSLLFIKKIDDDSYQVIVFDPES